MLIASCLVNICFELDAFGHNGSYILSRATNYLYYGILLTYTNHTGEKKDEGSIPEKSEELRAMYKTWLEAIGRKPGSINS